MNSPSVTRDVPFASHHIDEGCELASHGGNAHPTTDLPSSSVAVGTTQTLRSAVDRLVQLDLDRVQSEFLEQSFEPDLIGGDVGPGLFRAR